MRILISLKILCNEQKRVDYSFVIPVSPPSSSRSKHTDLTSHVSLSNPPIGGQLPRSHCADLCSLTELVRWKVERSEKLNLYFLFSLQPTLEHQSQWRWWGESCRARATPLSCAVPAPMSSWSRAPTMGAPTTRSVTRTWRRWRTLGATCLMRTRSCHKGRDILICENHKLS